MTRSLLFAATVTIAVLLAGCWPDQPQHLAQSPQQGFCPSNRYVGNVNGMPATAQLGTEVGRSLIYVGGQITSQNASYFFSGCEIHRDPYSGAPASDTCFAEVTEQLSGQRFRAELRFYEQGPQRGFVLISNAHEGLHSSSYNFLCQ